ncbi:cytosolic endo-beta-N-acetylglucosaminidase-like [Gigantopelta aegis]|uniref:cytosolic endo-beta-N-acetylglucosaminidase-like n=1 Tax=Gigantopelta aegis TaxID=1735272 RepID=UPI001B88C8CD|nr:cytosolic endo-beta-N-acetylglucosaminidase-like [Gigantopelta aegis]
MESESLPLKCLSHVLSWDPSDLVDEARAKVSLSARVRQRDVPRTLVCHDMKGGYQEDRFIQGSTNHLAYRFYHWQLIDTFVYFSHHFCTIPPPGWIDAAHKHDVRVLGTIITEWDEGKETCRQFLCDNSCINQLVRKLVDIAKFYKFDGWFINIENTVEVEQIGSLRLFLESLSDKVHEEIAHSQVLWYDSVIDTGELKWQDQLNTKNREFFNSCDGIFLNYAWDEEHLTKTAEIADLTDRRLEVYVGADVFGRCRPGRGGYNTKEALRMIRKENMSAAIFAPGWVHETQDVKEFTTNQNRFWNELRPFCYPHPISYLPLVTSFCQGYGTKYFLHGKPVGVSPWFNLSLQQVQPWDSDTNDETSVSKSQVYEEEAYLGGTCLHIQGQFTDDARDLHFKLFDMDVDVHQTLLVSYTYRQLAGSHCRFVVRLELHQETETRHILLTDGRVERDGQPEKKKQKNEDVEILCMERESAAKHFGIIPETENYWRIRYFLVESSLVSNWTLDTVKLLLHQQDGKGDCSFLVGQIQILPSDCTLQNYPQVTELTCTKCPDLSDTPSTDNSKYRVKWTCSSTSDVQYYNLYTSTSSQSRLLRGHTTVEMYVLDTGTTETDFTVSVQPVTTVGVAVPLNNCSTCVVSTQSL